MRSLLLSVALCLCFQAPQLLTAQIKYKSLAKVYVQNGWVLQGDTSLIDQGKRLKITTLDQQIFTFSVQEIDSIRKGGPVDPRQEGGLRHMVSMGFLMQNQPLGGSNSGNTGNHFSFSLQYVAGYYITNGPRVGIGSGISLFSRGYAMPLFLDVRGDLSKGFIRPHVYGQIGTSIPLYSGEDIEDPWGNVIAQDLNVDGGLLYELGVGIKFLARSNYAYLVSIGYRFQEITENYTRWEVRYKDEYSFRRISFQVGLMF